MSESFHVSGGDERGPEPGRRVEALQAAYRRGRLVVSGDPRTLASVRSGRGHAIDTRDVADALLRQLEGARNPFRRR